MVCRDDGAKLVEPPQDSPQTGSGSDSCWRRQGMSGGRSLAEGTAIRQVYEGGSKEQFHESTQGHQEDEPEEWELQRELSWDSNTLPSSALRNDSMPELDRWGLLGTVGLARGCVLLGPDFSPPPPPWVSMV